MNNSPLWLRLSEMMCLLFLFSTIHQPQPAFAQSPMPSAPGKPIKELLNSDGTVNLTSGFSGSLDISGFRMTASETGVPRFVSAVNAASMTSIDDDDYWDARFGPMGIHFGYVNALAMIGTDLYVGGVWDRFLDADGIWVDGLAKWDGTGWSAVGQGVSNVSALTVIGTDLYAAGRFTTPDGSINGIIKWDGSTWCIVGEIGEGEEVKAFAAIGTDLYVGGYFWIWAGDQWATYLARWDGTSWSALGRAINGVVHALAVIGSDLYVGGKFLTADSTIGEVVLKNIGKWDGTNWSPLGTGVQESGWVNAFTVSGSDLYAGGRFSTAGGITARNVAKWDGTTWSALGTLSGEVITLAASGGDLYAGGGFDPVGDNIVKWDGTTWSALGTMRGELPDAYPRALLLNGTDLYVGGQFDTVGVVIAHNIAQWDGTSWSAFGRGVDGEVKVVAVNETDVFAGGSFKVAGGVPVDHVAKWDGTNWSALGTGVNGDVWALAVSGSNLFAGGQFTTAGGVTADYVAKWDGSSWSALGTGTDGPVLALAVSGTDLYVGGLFTTAGSVTANNVAKWDGASWSALGTGVVGEVRALAVRGADLYAGGSFNTAGGVTVNRIAKWDGSSWSALGSGMSTTEISSTVYAIAVNGTDLYAGGAFTTAGSVTVDHVAKWDGTSWSALGTGMNGWVRALAVSGSHLYAGGAFTTAGGVTAYRVAGWNGSSWSTLGTGIYNVVNALAVSGVSLYAGGIFDHAGGKQSFNIGRWFKPTSAAAVTKTFTTPTVGAISFHDASNETAMDISISSTSGGPTVLVNRYEDAPRDSSSITGTVSQYRWVIQQLGLAATCTASVRFNISQIPANGISDPDSVVIYRRSIPGSGPFAAVATAYENGELVASGLSGFGEFAFGTSGWSALGSGMGGGTFPNVHALAVSGSDLYVGGQFPTAGGTTVNYIAKWNGLSWSALGTGMNSTVYALATSGSDLYAGGDFTTAGGTTVNRIAKWNGSSWSALGTGMNNSVRALAVSGSDLYAGGYFTTAGGATVNRIAKWNGSSWSALGTGMNGAVLALTVSPNGAGGSNLYAGGGFTTADGVPANRVAKWDGTSWSALGPGMNGSVVALAVSGSDLYASGGFTTAGGTTVNRIAKWNGSSWSALGSGMNNYPFALAVSGSDLYAGGYFATAGGDSAKCIAKWNGSSWSALGSGMNNDVRALAVSGSDLYAGGYFTTAGGKSCSYIARWCKPTSAAAVTKTFSTPVTDISFYDAINVTAVRMSVTSSSGGTTVLVNRYENAPLDSSAITGNVSRYRWIIQQTGLAPSFSADIGFRVSQIPINGISDPTSVVVYSRSTPGRGTFTALTTTYDATFDRISANGVSDFGEFAFGSTTNPLPVQIVGFSAAATKNGVGIRWSTATEVDNYGFEIERRCVGPTTSASSAEPAQRGEGAAGNGPLFAVYDSPQWSKVGFVQGSGTSTSPKEYSFTDENLPSGRYAYRIKQINNDGTFTYTSALELEIGVPQLFSLGQNYPNPFNPTTTIEFDLPLEVKVNLVIYDNLGRQVRTLVENVQPAGYYKAVFDAQGLSSGMYYYRIVAGDFVRVKKLLFVK